MKAFLIDPEARTVAEIDIDPANVLRDLYAAIDCELVTTAELSTLPGHDLWLDDEGRLADEPHGIIYAPGCGQEIFAGRAVVLGAPDEEGDTTEATCSAEDIRRRVFAVEDMLPGGFIFSAPLTVADAGRILGEATANHYEADNDDERRRLREC